MTLTLISQHLPKNFVSLLEGKKESKWIDVLKKADKKKREKGEGVSKLYKTIVLKTPAWHHNDKLRSVADKADTYLFLRGSEITKKAKKRYKEVHKTFTKKFLEGESDEKAKKHEKQSKFKNREKVKQIKAEKSKPKTKEKATPKPKPESKEVQQTAPLCKLSQDVHVHIAEFLVSFGNDRYLTLPGNLNFFSTCKQLNRCELPFLERRGKGLAVGDIIRQVFGFKEYFWPLKIPKKEIFQQIGKGVKNLDISGLNNVPLVPKRIAECVPSLEELTSTSNTEIEPFTHLKNLKAVTLIGYSLLDDVTESLEHIQMLSSLQLKDSQDLSDDVLKGIGSLQNLTHLNLEQSKGYTSQGFQYLAALQKLETLNVVWINAPFAFGIGIWPTDISPLNDAAMQEIAKITSLTSLDITNSNMVSDAMIPRLSTLTKLQTFRLNNAKHTFTGQGLQHLSTHLPQLKTLSLNNCIGLQNADLQHLLPFKQLQNLSMRNNNLDDVGLGHIARLSTLTCLNLAELQRFTNKGIEKLTPLKNLRELTLTRRSWQDVPSAVSINYLKEKLLPKLEITVDSVI
jgi:hypothetical protein